MFGKPEYEDQEHRTALAALDGNGQQTNFFNDLLSSNFFALISKPQSTIDGQTTHDHALCIIQCVQ
jgi:hypothetical protein